MIEPPDANDLLPLLQRARAEDLGTGDITTEAVVPAGVGAMGSIVAREPGVLCGTIVLKPLARLYDPGLEVEVLVPDGAQATAGQQVAVVRGPARAMLAWERVALNFLQRLSGVATATRAFVEAVAGTGAEILDTRKTVPGWRTLDKYAVRCGGGANHRVGLFDAVLVKDNHIALGREGDLVGLARRLRQRYPGTVIEVEVDSLDQLRELLAGAADVMDMVLLDNMTAEELAEAVRIRNGLASPGRPLLEASGGINLANVRAVAQTGVERISVGAITHSAKALDLSLEIEPGG